jgi:methionine-rich copper-binding protein CopC
MKKTLALAALTTLSALAAAHARLQRAVPADGAAVSPAPTVLRLKYDEPVEAAMSRVRLTGPGNAEIALGKVAADPDDDHGLVQALPTLSAGEYHVHWSTMGHDGHHTQGDLRFTVK